MYEIVAYRYNANTYCNSFNEIALGMPVWSVTAIVYLLYYLLEQNGAWAILCAHSKCNLYLYTLYSELYHPEQHDAMHSSHLDLIKMKKKSTKMQNGSFGIAQSSYLTYEYIQTPL